MTDVNNQNLNFGRTAISKSNFKEAKTYYESVYKECPENLEAEWFYRFGSVTEYVNADTANNYIRLVNIFYPTLKYISTLEEGTEKQNLVYAVVKGFMPLKEILHDAMVKAAARDRSLLPTGDIMRVYDAKTIDKKVLANDILSIFGEKAPYCFLATDIWKELIAERFKWSPYRNFKDKGKELWFDELAKRIKKYDPTYEMPQFKQAGCLASGEATKVTPGK